MRGSFCVALESSYQLASLLERRLKDCSTPGRNIYFGIHFPAYGCCGSLSLGSACLHASANHTTLKNHLRVSVRGNDHKYTAGVSPSFYTLHIHSPYSSDIDHHEGTKTTRTSGLSPEPPSTAPDHLDASIDPHHILLEFKN